MQIAKPSAKPTQRHRIISIITAVLASIIASWLIFTFIIDRPNKAAQLVKPIEKVIHDELGGERVCSTGDSGYGLDNTQPWYKVYYLVNDIHAIEKIIDVSYKIGTPLAKSDEVYEYYENPANYEPGLDQNKPYIENLPASMLLSGYVRSSQYFANYEITKDDYSYSITSPRLEVRIDYVSADTACIVNRNKLKHIEIPEGKAMVGLHARMPSAR